jgi:hypothetical protein
MRSEIKLLKKFSLFMQMKPSAMAGKKHPTPDRWYDSMTLFN